MLLLPDLVLSIEEDCLECLPLFSLLLAPIQEVGELPGAEGAGPLPLLLQVWVHSRGHRVKSALVPHLCKC